ncbi:MAG: hypothetical protein KGJ97_09665 [Xanthomonadaceae bacterium]|jgi:hypothetical protein|nr:hypothetical protein [Xanthomonadaceae bacterium]MDE3073431.1 hypothetical protein [Pseudomonadota bacterium]
MTRRIAAGLVVLGLHCGAVSAGTAPAVTVIYPHPESRQDVRERYPLQVLKLALAHSGMDVQLKASPTPMQQERSMRELAAGRHLGIMWSVESRERDSRLLSIPFAIDRGLTGWRVLLIHRGDEARFAAIDSKAQLSALVAGQGLDWPDLQVLRENGLRAVGSPTYEGLFRMLARRHIDYFPRSVAEVGDELARHPDLPIALESHLLLHYPEAEHFFVSRHNRALAEALTLGLRRSVADGSLQRLFEQTYGGLTRQLQLTGRRIIELDDPQAPREPPRQSPGIWFRPGESGQ